MDKLEEFIENNRKDFDIFNTPPGIWRRVKRVLNRNRSTNYKWISIAALVIVVLGSAMVFIKPLLVWTGISKISNNSIIHPDNPHLKEAEMYYLNLVNSLYDEAAPFLTANPEIKKELTSDISQLDSICREIKKDLRDNVDNQEVVEALIRNYRIKIHLLEDMLILLKENEKNPEKNNKYEL